MPTDVKNLATRANSWVREAHYTEKLAEASAVPHTLVMFGQQARALWVQALISFVHFFDALPEPPKIPPVPQPSDEAKRRGVLVGAVVRDVFGDVGRVVSHGSGGLPLVQWRDAVTRCGTDHLTVIRPAPPSREPNAEAVKRGLYIGARVMCVNHLIGEILAWSLDGNPIVETADCRFSWWDAAHITLAKNTPTE